MMDVKRSISSIQPTPVRFIQEISPDEAKRRQVEPVWQKMIHLTEAFALPDQRLGRTAKGVAVPLVFVDTGTQDQHPDIEGNLASWLKREHGEVLRTPWAIRRRITGGRDCSSPRPEDKKHRPWCYGHEYSRKNWQVCPRTHGDHGLMTSGMAAAVNNKIGIRGIDADVWMLKVFSDRNGVMICLDAFILAALEALEEIGSYYRPYGVYGGVANFSLGGHFKMASAIEDQANRLANQGWSLIASAGNDAREVAYPAAYNAFISVGALDEQGKPVDWSCRGTNLDQAAPGTNILTLCRNGRYCLVDGTSFSGPAVSIMAAILKARHPEISMNTYEMRRVFAEHATPVSSEPGWQLVRADELAALHKIKKDEKNQWNIGLRVA